LDLNVAEIAYQGSELDVFAHAHNWKRYVRSQICEYLTGDVLEVGAGIGSNALAYVDGPHQRWVCLEPDPQLASCISKNQALSECEVIIGTVADLPTSDRFDSIIYMDVLEHIADDAGELRQSALRLRPGGRLVVVAPAHQWLFTPFDRAIGHYRRYNASMLRQISPPGLMLERLRYLDTLGIAASLGNRLILSSASPSVQQIRTWDRMLVPLSRKVDSFLGYKVGKSVVAVWRAPDGA
jgi:SAM-dependent methyltransferase